MSQWGDSALMVAVREDRAEAIHLLLQSGAALDLQNMVSAIGMQRTFGERVRAVP